MYMMKVRLDKRFAHYNIISCYSRTILRKHYIATSPKLHSNQYPNPKPNQYPKRYPNPKPNQYPKRYPDPKTNLYPNKVLSQYSARTTANYY